MEYIRLEIQRQEGTTSGEFTVTFDHPYRGFGIKSCRGRTILRSDDGFYHSSPSEWESIRGTRGLVLISGAGW